MTKPAPIIFVLIFSLAVLGCTYSIPFSHLFGQQNGLSASISIANSSNPTHGRLAATLVLTNTSREPIRVCTLCQGWNSTMKGYFDIRLDPGNWKSASPSLEQSAREISTVQPGDSISLPFEIVWDETDQRRLQVSASYEVGADFAQKLKIWSGSVAAEPIIVRQP